MRVLSFIAAAIIFSVVIYGQSPHEKNLKYDCSYCHQSIDWQVIPSKMEFRHSDTDFPMLGQHSSVDCRSCHTQLKFSGTPDNCSGCHKDIHRNSVGFDCARCHTPQSWIVKDINSIHQLSRFPLTGVHLRTDCAQCHNQYPSLIFNIEGISCFDCHRQDYISTINPNHPSAGFSTECQDCHSINGETWSAENFAHDFFPLKGGHNIASCFSCHQQGTFSGLSKECYSCHKKDYDGTNDPNHLQANFPTDCSQCHNINDWDDANFDHSLSGFPLTGSHVNVTCSGCHQGGFTGTPAECFSCHQQNYNAASNHLNQNYPHDCTMCHSTTAWNQTNFNHDNTSFLLTGVHITTECSSCHTSGFAGTSNQCVSCHQDDYNTSTNPSHTVLSLSTVCQDCHSVNPNWEPAVFPVHNNYYVLEGAHQLIAANCINCHNGNYITTPNTCFGCHADDYNNANNPPHNSAGFSTECKSCHTQTAWTPSTFDHLQYFPIYSGRHQGEWTLCSDCHTSSTNFSVFSCIDCHEHNKADTDNEHQGVSGYVYASQECYACHPTGEETGAFNHNLSDFPLTGAHTIVNCTQCHQSGYSGTTTICYDCHKTNYTSSTNPNHTGLGLSTECSSCHSIESDWKPAKFPLHNQYFELTGRHLEIVNECTSCHNGNYITTNNQCSGCHLTDYNNAQNPNHQAAGISTTCASCHSTIAWLPSTFNHNSTGFQLTGQHINTQCSSCHTGSTGGLDGACVSCHSDDYTAAQNPNHQAAGIITSCVDCHTSTAWVPSSFSHASTGFQLTGQHSLIQCSSCHIGTTGGLNGICFSCHQDNYNSAPNHVSQNYPTDCSMCHNSVAWNQSTFNHSTTAFPLTGAHISTNCNSCHQSGFAGTTTVCSECHQQDYNSSANPGHTALQLSTNCSTCHTTNPDWQPALFPDHNNYYQLLGAHSVLINNCSGCHNGNYNTTPNTCFGCHSDDYSATTNPAHQSAGFPTECLSCHTQNAWTPSTFNHDGLYFPIYSGEHQGEWDLCSDCHTNPGNFAIFSCINCHEHNQTEMNEEHQGVTGYVYESNACLSCHPNGESGILQRQRLEIR